MVFWANNRIPAFTLYFLSRPGIFVPVRHPLAIATNFYGIYYSELPVHGGRTIWLPWQVLPGITNTRVILEIFGDEIESVRVKIGSIKPSQRVEGY